MYTYLYIYIYVCVCIYIYIYIHKVIIRIRAIIQLLLSSSTNGLSRPGSCIPPRGKPIRGTRVQDS